MPIAKQSFQKAVKSANQELFEIHRLSKRSFGGSAQDVLALMNYAKLPQHVMKSIYQAYLMDSIC